MSATIPLVLPGPSHSHPAQVLVSFLRERSYFPSGVVRSWVVSVDGSPVCVVQLDELTVGDLLSLVGQDLAGDSEIVVTAREVSPGHLVVSGWRLSSLLAVSEETSSFPHSSSGVDTAHLLLAMEQLPPAQRTLAVHLERLVRFSVGDLVSLDLSSAQALMVSLVAQQHSLEGAGLRRVSALLRTISEPESDVLLSVMVEHHAESLGLGSRRRALCEVFVEYAGASAPARRQLLALLRQGSFSNIQDLLMAFKVFVELGMEEDEMLYCARVLGSSPRWLRVELGVVLRAFRELSPTQLEVFTVLWLDVDTARREPWDLLEAAQSV